MNGEILQGVQSLQPFHRTMTQRMHMPTLLINGHTRTTHLKQVQWSCTSGDPMGNRRKGNFVLTKIEWQVVTGCFDTCNSVRYTVNESEHPVTVQHPYTVNFVFWFVQNQLFWSRSFVVVLLSLFIILAIEMDKLRKVLSGNDQTEEERGIMTEVSWRSYYASDKNCKDVTTRVWILLSSPLIMICKKANTDMDVISSMNCSQIYPLPALLIPNPLTITIVEISNL